MARRRRTRKKTRRLRILIGGVLLLAIATGLAILLWPEGTSGPGGGRRFQARQRHLGPLAASLFVSGNLEGRIATCDCEEGELGGVARVATLYARWADEHADRIIVDIGNAATTTHKAADVVNRFTFDALDKLGCMVVNCGIHEVYLPPEQLAALAKDRSFALVCANLVSKQTGKPVLAPYHIIERGTLHIGFLGLVDDDVDPYRLPEGRRVVAPEAALARELPTLKTLADLIVVLGYLRPERFHELARAHPDVNLFLGGRTTVSSAPAGEKVGSAAIAYLGDEGRSVGLLAFDSEPKKPPHIAFMPARLNARIARDPALAKLEEQFGEALSGADKPGADWNARMPCTGSFVGSDVCRLCHRQEYYTWLATKHAGAYVTLLQQSHHNDPNCLACHTTGYQQPDGYEPDRVPALLKDLRSEDEEARAKAAEALAADLPPLRVVPELIVALGNSSEEVRTRAHEVLDRIATARVAGEPEAPRDFDPKGEPQARSIAIENWTSWWHTHRARLLSPVEKERRKATPSKYPLVGVGCEACHGGARRHLGQALKFRKESAEVALAPHLRSRVAAHNCTACHHGHRPCLREGRAEPYAQVVTCERCQGRGKINPVPCKTCEGRGDHTGIECKTCGGMGKIFTAECPRCNGTGKVPNSTVYLEKIKHWRESGQPAEHPEKAATADKPATR